MNSGRPGLLAFAALAILCAMPAKAAPDPAATRIDGLCGGLIDASKAFKGVAPQARARKLEPLVDTNFNLEAMAQFAIGDGWAKFSPSDRSALIAALNRYMAARYAHEFETYSGQHCVVDPTVVTRGVDKLVRSQIVDRDDKSSVNYRLREYGGSWKVIDIYYEGVSQLATQRADFATTLRTSGAPGLIVKLNALTAAMR